MKSIKLYSALFLVGLGACTAQVQNDVQSGGTGGGAATGGTSGSGATGGTAAGGSGSSTAQAGSGSGATGGSGSSAGKGGSGGSAGKGGSGGSAGKGGSGGSTATPPPIPTKYSPGDCRLDNPAFCESFETVEAGGRGADINDKLWSFARLGQASTVMFSRAPAYSNEPGETATNTPSFCGGPFSAILPPNDVRLCDGIDGEGFASKQLQEVFTDSGGFASNSMRIRQPFDFRGRTGTIVFDLDAKLNTEFSGHGWWTEFWISQDPLPLPYHGAPTIASYPKNAIGFQIAPSMNECFASGLNQVGKMFIARDQAWQEKPLGGKCFKAQDNKLNRFKVLISKDHVEFWVTNYDDPKTPIKVASADGLNLNFEYGYVHFQHSQYIANKHASTGPVVGASSAQTYRWDNIGFDGPAYPTPRGYDVPNSMQPVKDGSQTIGTSIGYPLDQTYSFKLAGVDLTNALRATFNVDFIARANSALQFRVNGKAWHEVAVPSNITEPDAESMRALSAEVPLSELVSGDNTLEVQLVRKRYSYDGPIVGNMDISVETSK